MSATSRALAALTLSAAVLLPAQAAVGLPTQDPTPAPAASAPATEAKSRPVINAADGVSALPKIATKGWVLADLDTGEILAMQDPDRPLRPASTLKLLTALTVAPRLAPDQPYRAVKADEEAEGNRVVLYEGLKYTVADLLHAALLPSANDAAEALARANGGIDVTVEQMNAEAARLGAVNTTAKNPSGLDEDGQVTTARDLAAIGRAAFANPEIASYLTLRSVDFPGKREAGKRVIYPIYNHNRTVIDGFEGSLGGKSGFTSQARRTYVGAAERDGRRLIVSLLNISGNTYTTAETLLDWGFANAGKLTPRRHPPGTVGTCTAVRPHDHAPAGEGHGTGEPGVRRLRGGARRGRPHRTGPTASPEPGPAGHPDARAPLTADRPDPARRSARAPARTGLLDRPPQPHGVDQPRPVGHDPGPLREASWSG